MDLLQQDYDLQGAIVWSTIHPQTLRFSGYDGDDIAQVEKYQRSIEAWIGKQIFIPDLRTHEWVARLIDESNVDSEIKADGVVTQMRDRAIALLTADCSPILLYCPEQEIIWWIHGSKAAIVNGVIENTAWLLTEKLDIDTSNLRVFVGPTISQAHYEVSEGDEEGFQDINVKSWNPGKVLLDIRWEVTYRLWELWVLWRNIISPAVCTYGRPDKFSFRRKTHLKAQNQPFVHANNGNLIWFSD